MKKVILGIFVTILVFVSCNKTQVETDMVDQVESELVDNTTLDQGVLKFYSSTRMLTDEQIDSIADWHNEYLIAVMNIFSLEAEDLDEELTDKFIEVGIAEIGCTESELRDYMEAFDFDHYQYAIDSLTDDDVLVIVDSIQSYLANNPDCSYSSIQSVISDLEDFAYNNTEGSNYDVAMTFLATMENSIYLWMPEAHGGLGAGDDFIQALRAENNYKTVNWGLVADADGSAALGVLLMTWYLTTAGPVGVGAMVSTMGWAVAISSGRNLVAQLASE
jgi:hypothetical protein